MLVPGRVDHLHIAWLVGWLSDSHTGRPHGAVWERCLVQTGPLNPGFGEWNFLLGFWIFNIWQTPEQRSQTKGMDMKG